MPLRHFTPFLALFAVAAALLPATHAADDDPKPEDLVRIQKGTLPIIVTAPHGGIKDVPGVPERRGKNIAQFTTALDGYTDRIVEVFAAELEKKLGGKPWVIVAKFSRRFIDANRPPEQSYESETAKPYYDAYHGPLVAACKAVKEKYGRGLLLDVHGQGQHPDAICRGTRNGKTVTLLVDRYGWQAVTGKNSVMGRLERDGYRTIPRCSAPQTTKEDPLFSGAYTVAHYGSDAGYGIDAIQLEFGSNFRMRESYAKTGRDLADAVAAFYEAYLKDEK